MTEQNQTQQTNTAGQNTGSGFNPIQWISRRFGLDRFSGETRTGALVGTGITTLVGTLAGGAIGNGSPLGMLGGAAVGLLGGTFLADTFQGWWNSLMNTLGVERPRYNTVPRPDIPPAQVDSVMISPQAVQQLDSLPLQTVLIRPSRDRFEGLLSTMNSSISTLQSTRRQLENTPVSAPERAGLVEMLYGDESAAQQLFSNARLWQAMATAWNRNERPRIDAAITNARASLGFSVPETANRNIETSPIQWNMEGTTGTPWSEEWVTSIRDGLHNGTFTIPASNTPHYGADPHSSMPGRAAFITGVMPTTPPPPAPTTYTATNDLTTAPMHEFNMPTIPHSLLAYGQAVFIGDSGLPSDLRGTREQWNNKNLRQKLNIIQKALDYEYVHLRPQGQGSNTINMGNVEPMSTPFGGRWNMAWLTNLISKEDFAPGQAESLRTELLRPTLNRYQISRYANDLRRWAVSRNDTVLQGELDKIDRLVVVLGRREEADAVQTQLWNNLQQFETVVRNRFQPFRNEVDRLETELASYNTKIQSLNANNIRIEGRGRLNDREYITVKDATTHEITTIVAKLEGGSYNVTHTWTGGLNDKPSDWQQSARIGGQRISMEDVFTDVGMTNAATPGQILRQALDAVKRQGVIQTASLEQGSNTRTAALSGAPTLAAAVALFNSNQSPEAAANDTGIEVPNVPFLREAAENLNMTATA